MSTDAIDYSIWGLVQTGYHLRFCALSLLLYDYLITLDDEVELFWKRPWTVATYLFLWTRYGGLILLISTLSLVLNTSDRKSIIGISWFLVEISLGAINTWVVEAILFLRLYSLYNCARKIVYAAGSAFLAQMICLIMLCAIEMPIAVPSLETKVFGGMVYCVIGNRRATDLAWVYWMCFTLLEAFILALTIGKAYTIYRYQTGTSLRLTNLVSTLLWDSIYYSILIEFFYVSIVILNLINGKNYDVLAGPGFTMPIVMGGRMMLNVRRTVSNDTYRQNPSTPSQIMLPTFTIDEEPVPTPSWAFTYI